MKNPFPKLYGILLLAMVANSAVAQLDAKRPSCASSEIRTKLLDEDPIFRNKLLELESAAYSAAMNQGSNRQADYTLPVVVHIIHNNGSENISDALVIKGIQDLNEGFENINYYDQGTGLNTEIEFCLAIRAPDGTGTSGINRIQSTLTNMTVAEELDVKNLSRWDPLNYINIWLVNEICLGTNCRVAGFANFPAQHGQPDDGILMEARWFGSNHENSTVQIHEMGHYLGLYHTFSGGCKNDACLLDGDRVCDTPPDQSTVPVVCAGSVNSCGTDTDSGFTTDQDDMFWNYMDYGDWGCYSAFTQGQTDRMSFFLDNARNSLLLSQGYTNPCPVSTAISINAAPASIEIGGALTFSITSPDLNQFEWYINDVLVGTGMTLNYTFNDAGNFTIQVNGTNGNPLCTNSDFINLEVTCPVQADFAISTTDIFVNESVTLTSSSLNAIALEWFIDDVSVSTANSFNHVFTEEGLHEILLVARNNVCSDSSQIAYVYVSNPCENVGTKQLRVANHRPVQFRLLSNGDLMVFFTQFNSPLKISRLDANQNLIWAKTFDGPAEINPRDVIEDPSDNGLIFCGGVEENNITYGLIFKLDANGTFVWGQRSMQADKSFKVINQSTDGDFVAGGSQGFTPGSDSHIVKFKSNGALVWSKNYSGISGHSFKSDQNGDLFFSGLPDFAGFDSFGAVAKMDIDGNILWARKFIIPDPTNLDEFVYPALESDDAGGVVLGFHYQDATSKSYNSMLSLDQNGAVNWKNEYYYFWEPNMNHVQGRVRFIRKTSDGGYTFNSTLSNPLRSLIAKIDDQGNMIWSRNFTNDINLFAGHPRMEIMDNGNIVHGHENSIYITDENGLLGSCPIDDVPLETNDFLVNIENYNFQEIGNITYLPTTLSTSDVTIPFEELCANNFNAQADAELSAVDAGYCNNQYSINWEICNIGDAAIPIGTPYTLYDGDPRSSASTVILTQTLSLPLGANQCQRLQNIVASLPANDVFIVFNDDGTLITPFDLELDLPIVAALVECNYFNNLASISLNNVPVNIPMPSLGNDTIICAGAGLVLDPGEFSAYEWQDGSMLDTLFVVLPGDYEVTVTDVCGNTQEDAINIQIINVPMLDLGPDVVICENGIVNINAGNDFETYEWSDGSSEQLLTAWLEGVYSVTVTDVCGGSQSDEITISFDNATLLNLPDTLYTCVGDSLEIAVPGYLEYDWFPKNILDCGDCPNITAIPNVNTALHLLVETVSGCFSADSILLIIEDSITTSENISICSGSSIDIFGYPESDPGDYSAIFVGANGCDSIHSITLNLVDTLRTEETLDLCLGDSMLVFDDWVNVAGVYSNLFMSSDGCDSIHTIEVLAINDPTLISIEEIELCFGDSVFIQGNWIYENSILNETFSSATGCDSVHQIVINFSEEIVLDIASDFLIQNGQTVELTAAILTGPQNLTFSWSPNLTLNCTDCLSPMATPSETTIYTLTATDEFDCTVSIATKIEVEEEPSMEIYLANSFSPNGDALNDFIFPQGIPGAAKILKFSIYDRWGEVVFLNTNFELNDPSQGWNGVFRGKEMSPAVFVIVLEFELMNGDREMMVGDLLLLR